MPQFDHAVLSPLIPKVTQSVPQVVQAEQPLVQFSPNVTQFLSSPQPALNGSQPLLYSNQHVSSVPEAVNPVEVCHETKNPPCVNLIDFHSQNFPTNNVPTHQLDQDAPVFINSQNSPTNKVPTHQLDHNAPVFIPNHLNELCQHLSTIVHDNRLPVPEPGEFTGDPLLYPSWRKAFDTLIVSKSIHPADRIHYLKKYVKKDAEKCVKSLLLIPSEDSYKEAMDLLDKRFGNSYTIACAFKSKIESWPKISPRDALGLRDFSDFLKQCEVASRTNQSLHVLNDDTQNRAMLNKLPDWFVSKWAREVYKVREQSQRFPSFSHFVSFLSREADIACDPLTMLSVDRKSQPTSVKTATSEKFNKTCALYTTSQSNANVCGYCQKSNHAMDKCFKFKAKSMEEKKAYIVEKKLCFACLTAGHSSKHCRKRLQCAECSKKHPTPLHGDVFVKEGQTKQSSKTTNKSSDKCSTAVKDKVVLYTSDKFASKSTMIVPVYVSHDNNPDNEVLTYAILDTQSDTTFVTDNVLANLEVNGTPTSLMLSTMTSDNMLISCQRVKGLSVRAYDGSDKIQLPVVFSQDHIPAGNDSIPSYKVAEKWPYLRSVVNQLMPKSSCGVGLLIGYNCPQALVPREVVPPVDNGPFAQRTDLGWGIIGLIESGDEIAVGHHVCSLISGSCITLRTSGKEILSPWQISQFFNQEDLHTTGKPVSQDDMKFLSIMHEQIHQSEDGHYELPLPLRNPDVPPGPNNRAMALQRLTSLVKRFRKDPLHYKYYMDFMNDLFTNGYAERVPASELSPETPAYYLPHHGVYNPSKPGKIRVVMDGSAKYLGMSLNDHLLTGPDLMNNLVGVLCRFRTDLVAFTCDIQGMFQQFRVNQEHRNFLRFFWFENGNYEGKPVEYRSTVHLFGAASSPAVANFALKRAASDYEESFGSDVKDFVQRNFYVDDGLMSLPSVDEAASLVRRSIAFAKSSGLKLHKFVSNSRNLLQIIPAEERASTIKDLDICNDHLPLERALGVKWCVESDTFQFRIVVKDNALTRRGVLSTVCSIFDPLGLIAPVVLQGKQILQSLCRDQLDWDEPIPDSTRARWEKWLLELPILESLEVSRCFKPADFSDIVEFELHSFADASQNGYGQCSYLRLKDSDSKVHCSLVMAKSRVAPLKSITIPRLELSAAVLSTEVSCLLQSELSYSELKQVYWTDSKIVLGFIANTTKRFQIYVANRVQRIRDCSSIDQWYHVRTAENPADLVSRGCTGTELLKSSWFRGPDYLWKDNIEYSKDTASDAELPASEIKHSSCLVSSSADDPLQPFKKFSSWKRIVRIVSVCFKFVENLRLKVRSRVNVADEVKAERWLMKQMQQASFSTELQKLRTSSDVCFVRSDSKLSRLDPFLDNDGLIRVGGRIKSSSLPFEMKHPVVLPKDHYLTPLILQHFHEHVSHQGKGITSNAVRSHGLWILGLSSLVSSLIYKCVVCRRLRHNPQGQKMSDLPEERVEPSPPFTHSAVDYFGPFYIKEGRKELKRYGVLFTCLSSRAIHIETSNSLDTDSFINALRRFLCIRGPMRSLRSDRGTNIVGGINQLQEAIDAVDDDKVREFLMSNSCDYLLNVPNASHQGGIWERQIRSVRNVLNVLLHKQGHQLNDEGFRTLMAEASNIVNSRPLTTMSINDPCSLQPLTPNHLLTLKSNVVLPPPGQFQNADVYSRKLWRRVQHLANEFWHRWRKEYLIELNSRQKWQRPKRNLQVNDIVLIIDDSVPRCFWKLAKVSELYPSKDGLVRKVKVQLGNPALGNKGQSSECKFLERPIHKLVLLLEANSN